LRIAFVTTESPYGEKGACGIGSYQGAIIPSLVAAGHEVTVFAGAKENRSFRAVEGRVTVHHFRLPSLHWYSAKVPGLRQFTPLPLRQLEWSRAFHRRVAQIGERSRFDVIEGTEAGSLFLSRIAPVVIRLHGSELIFRKHSGTPLNHSVTWNDKLEGISCKRAAAVTTPSAFQANEIISHRGWPADRVRVIPNPISQNILQAARVFKRNGHADRLILYTGRLAPVKGIETLLKAAKLVLERDPSARFMLAGPWQMPHSPAAYGLKLGQNADQDIVWIGPQTQEELIDLYKRARVFVMPSHYESFGISAVEALAFGLRVVATDAGALPEILGSNDATVLVAKRDVKALAEAITTAISLQPGSVGDAGGEPFEKYAPARIASATLELYEKVCDSDRK
jgi:glycosyltransferase involved in cell wall biosynthesis